jgi:CHAT domain-containing protein/tetratricopeptide (TPR) repeat protein
LQRPLAAQRLLLGVLLAAAVAACSEEPVPEPAPAAPTDSTPAAAPSPLPELVCCLQAGEVAEGDLGAGARARFAFDLAAGDGIEVVARQNGADVAILVADSAGRSVLRLDRPIGRSEPEHLVFVAEGGGTHLVEVESLEKTGNGRYRVEVVALGPATPETRRRARAIEHLALGHELRRSGAVAEAVERYRQAAEAWRALAEDGMEADALAWMAWGLSRQGRQDQAAEGFRRSAEGFRAAAQVERQAAALSDLGDVLLHLGRGDEALASYQQALALWRRIGDPAGEAKTLTQLANFHKIRNELSAAELHYKDALALWETLDRPRDVAITLANLAGIYSLAGQPELALDLLARASSVLPGSASPGDRAFVLEETGLAHGALGQTEEALAAYREALSLSRQAGSSKATVAALDGLAGLEYQAKEYEAAAGLYAAALSLVEAEGDGQRAAMYLQNLAWVHLRSGEPEQALALFGRALPTLQQGGFPAGEAATLAGIARVERELGHFDAASSWAERSLDVLEEIRAGSDRLDLRSSLLATKQSHFDFAVDTLMERHRREPGGGFDALAFEVSERARARRLLDALPGAPGSEIVADPAGGPALGSFQRRVNAAEEDRLRLLGAGAGERELGRAERTLRAALEDLRSVRGRIQPDEGRRGAAPRPLSLAEIQRSVLEPDTLLLSYDLGEERSYLWAVSSRELVAFVLPAGEVLEREARGVHDLLAHSHERGSSHQVELQAAKLSRRLLEPVAVQLHEHRRLLISVEGDLHAVPFGALPDPSGGGEPLLARHELAYAPSASALAWLDARPAPRSAAPRKLLAVVADPVFGPDDDRLRPGSPRGQGAGKTPPALGGPDLERLPYSRAEAEALRALGDAEDVLVAQSFDARKELVTGGGLAGFRILHFATHGWFSAEHPELSALVLSRLDPAGRPRDGVLWAHEISALHLPAELVVLSACDTGLGSAIHGEGFVGLSHAFFRAGAPRVVVSLWRVDDQAAVELMSRFYQALLREGLPASEALRRAQLSMRGEPRWQRPFYWAGFVLQGEW